MFNPNFTHDNFETDPSFLPNDFSTFMLPDLNSFGSEMFPKDFQSFSTLPEFEGFDPSNFMQYFDQALLSMPEEIKQIMSIPFESILPQGECFEGHLPQTSPKPSMVYSRSKIGTLSQEERRQKVLKYLEKRKRRSFKKKISYMCRKKVADQRVRIKGRFVSKVQASAISDEKEE